MILTKEQLFLSQAPAFNFELNADEIVAEALKRGFVKQIGDDQYLLNENY